MNFNENFRWERHPKAEALVEWVLEKACSDHSQLSLLQSELEVHTSTRLFDWLDHIVVGCSPSFEAELADVGFIEESARASYRIFFHPGAQLPRVIVQDSGGQAIGIAVKVESAGDFLAVRGWDRAIVGDPLTLYRTAFISKEKDVSLSVVERRGAFTMDPSEEDASYASRYLNCKEMWQLRPRGGEDEEAALEHTISLAQKIAEAIGQNVAAWIVLECERHYWQAKNLAGQLQKGRQDRLGMGWANHDHHTFRSSRRHFRKLVRLFEVLGFHCRERFYAGEEAGWGAQVMENSRCGLVLFLDVDLASHELEVDFSHQPIGELDHLGTIGLWCALHGDSILGAGMHHLEAQFFHERLTQDLAKHGMGMMPPFSDFPYLKQAFTTGEIWHVNPVRVERLLKEGKITVKQAEKFSLYGAVGSHLENLQRREGYKGFNQQNVSFIIKKTDPRLGV